ncbi:unnamed protein product [Cuscuta epithymum]|uniref:Uncharacterized protein n=1 Tax=Cuscuta epithymum TaxID=186058 RepID=A0AAV0EN57_9ASTE|nr:unnamed protein product [Cuscuta epithymum]
MTHEEEGQDKRPIILGFALRTEGNSAGCGMKAEKSELFCTYCKYSGHDIANCFEFLGYSDRWGERPRAESKGGGCEKTAIGEPRIKLPAKAHAAVTENGNKASVSGEGSIGQSTPLPGFTSKQWTTLMSVFGNSSSTNDRVDGPPLEEADWNR